MRKIISIFSTLVLATLSTGQVIACTNPFIDPNVLRVTIVTDGHTISDRSFNESSYDSVLEFKEQFNKWIVDPQSSAPQSLRNKHVAITVAQPPTTDLYSLLQAYQNSVFMNSYVTIASGFIQNNALVAAENKILKNKMRYIYVDGDTPNSVVPYENKDLAGILYKAEQSGLMAGIAGCTWLAAHASEYGGFNNLKVSTYGGLNIPAVTNYMYGFYWAVKLFNVLSSNPNFSSFNTEVQGWVKKLNPTFNSNLPTINFINLPNQFTGDFNQSSQNSKALNGALVDKGTQIIFPVAGPQTSDTLAALKSKGNGMIIGVDTDQQKQYPESANRFITSALKDIVSSVNYMLWRSIDYDDSPQHNQLPAGEQDKIFKENAPYRGGEGFTGIANNQAIDPIYQDIMTSATLNQQNGLLDQVSIGWQKVLQFSGDYWINGKSTNPFSF